jgi:hypothetical protein
MGGTSGTYGAKEKEMHAKFWLENLKETDYLQNLGLRMGEQY